MSENIPTDIDKIATDIVRADYTGDEEPDWLIYLAIAKAILAERDRHTPAPLPNVVGSSLTNEQKEITLLRIIEAMGGETDSSESKWSWLNWFCSDEIHNVQDDTFNRCNDKGWLRTTHNSDTDCSTSTLTASGRAALSAEVDNG